MKLGEGLRRVTPWVSLALGTVIVTAYEGQRITKVETVETGGFEEAYMENGEAIIPYGGRATIWLSEGEPIEVADYKPRKDRGRAAFGKVIFRSGESTEVPSDTTKDLPYKKVTVEHTSLPHWKLKFK